MHKKGLNKQQHTKENMPRDKTDRAWFSRLLRHPARKRSGSILRSPGQNATGQNATGQKAPDKMSRDKMPLEKMPPDKIPPDQMSPTLEFAFFF